MVLTYGSLNLQSDTIITETVQFRSMADRVVNLSEISRRPGSKFLSDEFGSKKITMTGRILAPTPSGMAGIVDEIQKELAKTEQALTITEGRSYTATATRVRIPEQRFSQTLVPFTFDFVSSSPFTTSASQSVGFVIPSGTLSTTVTTTISGSAFAEPTVTYTTLSGAGDSGMTSIRTLHATTGDEVTVSGTFSLGDVETVLNYERATVTVSGLLSDYTGSFSRWSPGSNSIQVVLGGANNKDLTGLIQYSPRFYS